MTASWQALQLEASLTPLHPSILPGFPLLDYTLRCSNWHFQPPANPPTLRKKPTKPLWDWAVTATAQMHRLYRSGCCSVGVCFPTLLEMLRNIQWQVNPLQLYLCQGWTYERSFRIRYACVIHRYPKWGFTVLMTHDESPCTYRQKTAKVTVNVAVWNTERNFTIRAKKKKKEVKRSPAYPDLSNTVRCGSQPLILTPCLLSAVKHLQ